jgi:hypothetical protein
MLSKSVAFPYTYQQPQCQENVAGFKQRAREKHAKKTVFISFVDQGSPHPQFLSVMADKFYVF